MINKQLMIEDYYSGLERGDFHTQPPSDFDKSPSPPRNCGCGCGQPTKIITHTCNKDGRRRGEYNRFINGHWARLKLNDPPILGKHLSIEHKRKIGEALKGDKNPRYGKHLTKEHKLKFSFKDRTHTKVTKHKISEAVKGENHPQYGTHLSKSTKLKQSNSLKGKLSGNKHPLYGKHHSKSSKEKMSTTHRKNWDNPEYIKKMIKAQNIKPSSYELKLIDLIVHYDLDFQYVGDYKEWINGKNPDFISENKKQIIECYNTFYKLRQYGSEENYKRERRNAFYGYKVIFLNEEDINPKNWRDRCLSKIKRGTSCS